MTDQTMLGLWWKPDKTMMLWILQLRFTSKTKLNYHDKSDRVRSVMKIRDNNNVTDRIGTVYAENENELSWPIRQGVVYDKNDTQQWRDQSYRCALHRKRYWTIVTYRTKCDMWWKLNRTMTWPIVLGRYMRKNKLNYRDQSSRVRSMTKMTQDNDMTNRTSSV